ncbi:MAG: CHAP domain-containing protein [Enterobacteriaceae bacterium]|jgi:hypothetical protein|nr:CHAP domain-containing protein [Enterobacteriaceae bacterium]
MKKIKNRGKLPMILVITLVFLLSGIWVGSNLFQDDEPGRVIDSFNGVEVYYNGRVNNVFGRNLTKDNYNLGLKYQCVEFVKRYYYEYMNHKMPDSYGHAKDFFDFSVKDGEINKKRALNQFTNPSRLKPKVNDLIIFGPSVFNWYGHVAIISAVNENEIEIIQQNPGVNGNSRVVIPLSYSDFYWKIENKRIMGWLRKDI